MAYKIAEETFDTKEQIKQRCRAILYRTSQNVDDADDVAFLFDLFEHHDEWQQKSAGGVKAIAVYQTPQGTPCFHLIRHDGSPLDISFPHAIACIPTARSAKKQPQWLKDYRAAARQAITPQIYAFRDQALVGAGICPVSGEPVIRTNCHVDHVAPQTFDQLLFDFSVAEGIRPRDVRVGSIGGTVPIFEDTDLFRAWVGYHQTNAHLRLISARGNQQLPKVKVPWDVT